MPEGRRYFFFGITVSEIAFILFFVLLLFMFIEVRGLEKGKSAAEKTVDELNASAEVANGALQKIRQAFGDITALNLDDPITVLRKAAEAIEVAREKDDLISDLQEENDALAQQSAEVQMKIGASARETANLQGQVANLRRRAGVGLPPCWVADESGDIEYLFRVRLFGDESVHVERDAPKRRDAEYESLPSVPDITEGRLAMESFERLARPIYDVGMGSTPECRHFVKVEFADRESCRLLLITERYFYKVVVESASRICTG